MAVYNGADFIEHSLGAVLRQTYTNFTVVVSDNASTDGTWEILQTLAAADPRIVVHRQDTKNGLTRNFRFVLDQAETTRFMWHEGDDWIAPNYLEELLSVYAADPGCVLACPFGARVDHEGTILHREAFSPLAVRSRLGRIRALLTHPEGAWIYGLFSTQALRSTWAIAEEFKYLWASDAVALLHLILNDQIRGTDRTVFFFTIG